MGRVGALFEANQRMRFGFCRSIHLAVWIRAVLAGYMNDHKQLM
jgi:hypothetical protein